MSYLYTAFGVAIESSFELPGLNKREQTINSLHDIVLIREAAVPYKLMDKPIEKNRFGQFSNNESILILPNVAKFYICNGHSIDVEPLCGNKTLINQHLYANGLSLLLLQRNILLFHCSGIFINDTDVVLFAAPKNTGKSTLSVLMHQKGYLPFTDDTTSITFDENACYAHSSFPILRLFENSFLQQNIYKSDDRQMSNVAGDKSVFYFNSRLTNQKAIVKGIVFLECASKEMFIKQLPQAETNNLIVENIYRKEFIRVMKKQRLEFDFLSNISGKVAMWKAVRPDNLPTYAEFTTMIEKDIVHKLLKK